MEMMDFLRMIVTEAVWRKVRDEFQDYVQAHFETLNPQEQKAFAGLLMGGDEFTTQILDGLWEKFSATACTDERMKELFSAELKDMGIDVEL